MHQTLVAEDLLDVGAFNGEWGLDNFLGYADAPEASPNSFLTVITDLLQNGHADSPTLPKSPPESHKHLINENVPRHRRNSHVRAEKKRRKNIYEKLRSLQSCVPALASNRNSTKLSELECLQEAGEHIKERKAHQSALKADIEQIRKEKDAIQRELNQFQAGLPTSGLKKGDKPIQTIADRCNAYRRKKCSEDWRYGIFDCIAGSSLAETYTEQTGSCNGATSYLQSLMKWTEGCLCLSHLRPVVISGLRDVGTNTSFLTKPELIQQEISNYVKQPSLPPSAIATSPTVSTSAVTTTAPAATITRATTDKPSVIIAVQQSNPATATTVPHTAVNTATGKIYTAVLNTALTTAVAHAGLVASSDPAAVDVSAATNLGAS